MLEYGLVDYVLGAEPGPGVFVIGYCDDPTRQQYLEVFKMGEGPLYVFYTPYHLPHIEAPLTVARAVLFEDATITPKGSPVADVIAMAKKDLKAGDTIDGLGGFACYGMLDNTEVVRKENLLPMGLAEGARLVNDVSKDQALTFDDVGLPEGRLIDRLWAERERHFASSYDHSVSH